MNNIIELIKRVIAEGKVLIVPSVLIALFLLCGCNDSVIYTEEDTVETVAQESEYEEDNTEEIIETDSNTVIVHVCGAVVNPGVYELNESDRIVDAVVKAGGFSADADENAINLASLAVDGAKIYIPTIGEEQMAESNPAEVEDKRVNINTANEELLTTITGIGPSRAKAIVLYREEHGAFKKVEDITNVSGIGPASLEKMRDMITVN